MKKIIEVALIIVCLIPLFFINVKNSHDWGDDFAQYVHQAKNINSGVSQNQTGYIFNENCFTGPIAYPVGFPLLLSPIVKFWGLDFYHFNLLQSLFLALSCLLGFLMIRQYSSFLTAIFVSLIVAYNPMLLNFKTEVISDLSFTFFSMFSLYLMQKKQNVFLSILLGLLIAFSIHIRSVGVLLVFTYLFNQVFLQASIRNFSLKANVNTGITLFTCILFYLGLKLAWPCNTNYPGFFETEHYWRTVNEHLSYNLYHLSMFFRGYPVESYWHIGIMASAALLVFALFGVFHFYSENKKSIYVYYLPVYVLMVISYKFSHAGMRFLYPVLFLLFLFAVIGLKKAILPWIQKQHYLALLLGSLVLFSYHEEIQRIQSRETEVLDGPQSKTAVEAFQYINAHIVPNSIVAFDKPRALCLYTHVQSFAIFPAANSEQIAEDLKKFKAGYYLSHETQSTDVLKQYPLQDSSRFKLIYANADFKLFRIQKNSPNQKM